MTPKAPSPRRAEITARKKRVEAAELEARAYGLMKSKSVMEAEAMRLMAYAARLRAESDG